MDWNYGESCSWFRLEGQQTETAKTTTSQRWTVSDGIFDVLNKCMSFCIHHNMRNSNLSNTTPPHWTSHKIMHFNASPYPLLTFNFKFIVYTQYIHILCNFYVLNIIWVSYIWRRLELTNNNICYDILKTIIYFIYYFSVIRKLERRNCKFNYWKHLHIQINKNIFLLNVICN